MPLRPPPPQYKSSSQLLAEFEERCKLPTIAVDTETTGLDLRHGCQAYMVTTFSPEEKDRSWVFPVDPQDREPQTTVREISRIQDYLDGKQLVFQNPKFDVLALRNLGINIDWSLVDDTLTASHVLDNKGSHGLKEMGTRYLLLPATDQTELKEASEQARKLARKLKWDIWKEGHPHAPGFKVTKTSPAWYCDTWIPCALWDWKHERMSTPSLPFDLDEIPDSWKTVSHTYGVQDAYRTLRLWHLFVKGLMTEESLPDPSPYSQKEPDSVFRYDPTAHNPESRSLLHKYLERREVLPVLFEMECRGMPISQAKIEERITVFTDQAKTLESSLQKMAGDPELNPRSGPQLGKVLYGPDSLLKQPVSKMTAGGAKSPPIPATDKGSIVEIYRRYAPEPQEIEQIQDWSRDSLAYKFSRDLLCSKKFEKAVSTLTSYQKHLLQERLHTSILLHGTDTTRISSRDPNLTNVSKDDDRTLPDDLLEYLYQELGLTIRSAFGPQPGTVWYAIDWNSIQLRLFAYVSGEQALIDAFEQGWDPHDYMAHRVFKLPEDKKPHAGQRTIAKNVNFGFIFGASPNRITELSGIPGLYEDLQQMFPNAIEFMETTIRQVRRKGYVYTPGGYRLYVSAEHAGVNYIIQGAEGEIAQLACRLCHDEIQTYNGIVRENRIDASFGNSLLGRDGTLCETFADFPLSLLMLVHDELLFEAQGTDTEKHKPAVRKMAKLMHRSGDLYAGYNLPVDVEVIKTTWDKKEDYSLAC